MTKENLTQYLQGQLFSSNIVFIEEIYQKFKQNPDSVDASWQEFFSHNEDEIKSVLADYKGPSWARRDVKVIGSKQYDISSNSAPEVDKKKSDKVAAKGNSGDLDLRVANLALAYQKLGHLAANIDPLGLMERKYVAEIDYKNHGINDEDFDKEVDLKGICGIFKAKIGDIIDYLNGLFTGSIGAEFEYIANSEVRKWLSEKYAQIASKKIEKEEKIRILDELIRTNHFEQFLHKRFPGAKRFSIEGGDSSINAVEKIIDASAKNGVKKIVIGMAHRGRLNSLTGVMGKPYHQMISEFKGTPGIPENFTKSGDVKYHMGYASTREIAGNKIDLSLAFNPSHLEAVNSVVAGRVRAKQKLYKDADKKEALAVLIHGDAAFIGQGSVAENLVMNGVAGFNTGGVLHIIVNNQIGFTANPTDSRCSIYASDLAKTIDAPIFHVNGDDVEAVVKITELAFEYRQKFKKDIVLDIVCYRRYGHNEGDEPAYTQPVMYAKIKTHPTLEEIYAKTLVEQGAISQEDYKNKAHKFDEMLSKEFDLAQDFKPKEADWLKKDWAKIVDGDETTVKTALPKEKLQELIEKITLVPIDFGANKKIVKQLEARKDAVVAGKNIDWGNAEGLAFASLIDEGFPVRLSGQDAGRGTFSHRHSILHDANNGEKYNIFTPFANEKADYEVYDSVLSEYAALGFEYGYSLSMPYGLTIWEAQFGDFANGAQIIFDQFVASSEVKWLRKSGLVMLLPHGYEGQGPEHSSARLERVLQACADKNLRVCNITNPANFFHALRRQVLSKDRKPLVIMSPKSLLRHKLAVSEISEFTSQNFSEIIAESSDLTKDDKIRKVIFCSGKVYYDLFEARQEKGVKDVAIIRLEQIYPFAEGEIVAQIKKYKNAQIIWCQEEPKNMGAWKFVEELFEDSANKAKHKNPRPAYVGRVACASPATGYGSYHAREQKALIDEALS
jgi:2-oxoglutarate dehydrogenase E1 component